MFGFAKKKTPPPDPDEPLVIVPVPALVLVLLHKERDKGSPLTQAEVEDIRDNAVCISMPLSLADKMREERGYPDLDAERCWEEWSARRQALRKK